MLYRPETPETDKFVEYQHLPKLIGSVPAATLLEIAEENARLAATIDNHAALRFEEVAGSSFIEAALVSGAPGEEVDERLDLIDQGLEHLRTAADIEFALLEGGFRDPDDQADWRHLELAQEFGQVYRDMVCGEVTDDTKRELLQVLPSHYRYANSLAKHSRFAGEGRGLREEIGVLQRLWERRTHHSGIVAFPSTVRGGSGMIRPSETHDVVLAIEHPEGWEFDTVEVKTARTKLRNEHLVRYASHLAFIDSGGNLRWFDKMSA